MELTQYTRCCLVSVLVFTLVGRSYSGVTVQRRALDTRSNRNATRANDVGVIRDVKTAGWWPLLRCIFLADINKCLQDRTVKAIIGLGRKDEVRIDANKGTIKLPGEPEENLFEVLGDIMTDGIKRFFQDDNTDVGDDGGKDSDVESGDNGDNNSIGSALSRTSSLDGNANTDVESGRGKKIKKLIHFIKLIVVIVLIKLKIAFLFYIFGKIMQFKLVLLIALNTLINLAHLFIQWKKKQTYHEPHIYHYEEAHHDHIHDDTHFNPYYKEDKDEGLFGSWSRKSLDGGRSISSHDLAYSAHEPNKAT